MLWFQPDARNCLWESTPWWHVHITFIHSCSWNHFETLTLWHGALSCWKCPLEAGKLWLYRDEHAQQQYSDKLWHLNHVYHHHHTTSNTMHCWQKAGRLHGSMLLTSDGTLNSINQATSVNLQCCWVCITAASLSETWCVLFCCRTIKVHHVVHPEMLLCSPQLVRDIIWVAVTFLSPQTSLTFLLLMLSSSL